MKKITLTYPFLNQFSKFWCLSLSTQSLQSICANILLKMFKIWITGVKNGNISNTGDNQNFSSGSHNSMNILWISLPKDSFGICTARAFQNCPWLSHLTKYWMRKLRLKIKICDNFQLSKQSFKTSNSIFSAINWSFEVTKDIFGKLLLYRFQHCPWNLNLTLKYGRYLPLKQGDFSRKTVKIGKNTKTLTTIARNKNYQNQCPGGTF